MYYSLLIDYNGPLRFKNKENLATPKTHLFRVYEFAPYEYMPMYCTVNYMLYHQIRAAVLEFFYWKDMRLIVQNCTRIG